MTIKIRKAGDPTVGDAPKPVNVRAPKRTASGTLRKKDPAATMASIKAAEAMQSKGVVGPPSDGSKLTGDELLHQYISLDSIGAPFDTIVAILQVSRPTVMELKRKARALYVNNLSEAGVMGTIGTSFHRIELASQRAMALLATLADKDPKTLDAARAVVSFESQKIDLLVRTGAIKVKHRVEVSAELEPDGMVDSTIMSGAAAMRLLSRIQAEDAKNVTDIELSGLN